MATATGKPAATELPHDAAWSAQWYRTTHESRLTTRDGGRPSTFQSTVRGVACGARDSSLRTATHTTRRITSSSACWLHGRVVYTPYTDHSGSTSSMNNSCQWSHDLDIHQSSATLNRVGGTTGAPNASREGSQCSSVHTNTIRRTASARLHDEG